MSCNVGGSCVSATPLARFLLAFVLGGLATTGVAQKQELNHAELMARMEAAQAAASRPGDTTMNCDQLEKELVTAANDPALLAYVGRSGAVAKQQMEASTAASGRVATQTAMTIMSAVVPGAAMAGMPGMVAQGEAQKAAAAGNISQHMQQAQEFLAFLPQMMRGQRIIELAQARKCDWIQ